MLYNIELKKVQSSKDCVTCKHFDRKRKKCLGVGKCCLEFDHKTQTIIDPITNLPLMV